MTAVESPTEVASALADEELFQLELRIAQRADQLSRGGNSTPGRDLEVWFQAERDVFAENKTKRTAASAG
jgi:hypothetical protein